MTVLMGRTSAGTNADFVNSGDAVAWEFTASASGQAATIWFQSKVANNSPATTSVELGIYDDGGTVPGSKLGSATNSVAAEIQGTGAFKVTLSPTISIVASTQYWLAMSQTGAGGFDFQGDLTPDWSADTAAFPLAATWVQASTGGIAGVIWVEDATVLVPQTTFGPRRTNNPSGPYSFIERRTNPAPPTPPSTVTVKRLPATGVG